MCITPKRLTYSKPSPAFSGRAFVPFAALLRRSAIVPARPVQKAAFFTL
jgi:ABC-type uncharacterized transport system YnjBCD substrate-binding protein